MEAAQHVISFRKIGPRSVYDRCGERERTVYRLLQYYTEAFGFDPIYLFSPSFGLLLRDDIHHAFDRGEWTLYEKVSLCSCPGLCALMSRNQDDFLVITFFVFKDFSLRQFYGNVISPDRFGASRSKAFKLPQPSMCYEALSWHVSLTIDDGRYEPSFVTWRTKVSTSSFLLPGVKRDSMFTFPITKTGRAEAGAQKPILLASRSGQIQSGHLYFGKSLHFLKLQVFSTSITALFLLGMLSLSIKAIRDLNLPHIRSICFARNRLQRISRRFWLQNPRTCS